MAIGAVSSELRGFGEDVVADVPMLYLSNVPAGACVFLSGVQNGYVRASTGGRGRPPRELKDCEISSENVPARAREWTRLRYTSFPRNEGVRGSNPRVGFS